MVLNFPLFYTQHFTSFDFSSFSFLSPAVIVYFLFISWLVVWPDPLWAIYVVFWEIFKFKPHRFRWEAEIHYSPPYSLMKGDRKENPWFMNNIFWVRIQVGNIDLFIKQLYLQSNLLYLMIFIPWNLVLLSYRIRILIILSKRLQCDFLIWYFVILQQFCVTPAKVGVFPRRRPWLPALKCHITFLVSGKLVCHTIRSNIIIAEHLQPFAVENSLCDNVWPTL